MLGLALAGGMGLAVWRGRSQGIDADAMWELGIVIVVAAILVSRLEYVRTQWPKYADSPARILSFSDGGLVFYGGIVGALLGIAAWSAARRIPMRTTLDLYAPSIALGHALGRLGCFFAGCCYGRPTDVPWAVTFPEGGLAPAGLPLHPTQLYEAAAEATFGVLLLLAPPLLPGRLAGGWLMAYAIFRSFNETFRGDGIRGYVLDGLLSNAQATSIAMFAVGLLLSIGPRARSTR